MTFEGAIYDIHGIKENLSIATGAMVHIALMSCKAAQLQLQLHAL